MKFLCIAFISIFILFSCKKECLKNNILKGKLKTLTEYDEGDSVNNLSRFYYYYDSISGTLADVIVVVKISGIYYYPGAFNSIKKINSNTIRYSDRLNNRDFNIKLYNKQITEIYEVDTLNETEWLSTNVLFNNNSIDTIFDIGGSLPISKIKYYGLSYSNNNCISYSSTWTESFTGDPIVKSSTYNIGYTSLENSRFLKNQSPGALMGGFDNASVMNVISYFLGIDGYNVVKNNKNLIDTLTVNGITTKYMYTLSNEKVTKVKYVFSGPPYKVNDMVYYD